MKVEFPKFVYSVLGSKLVKDQVELEALGPGWVESPADVVVNDSPDERKDEHPPEDGGPMEEVESSADGLEVPMLKKRGRKAKA